MSDTGVTILSRDQKGKWLEHRDKNVIENYGSDGGQWPTPAGGLVIDSGAGNDPIQPVAIAAFSNWCGERNRHLVDLNHRNVQADGLACPQCEGHINFITPYYGRDECDLDNQMVGIWTWWIFIPFAELISAFRALTGNSPGSAKKLYHCVQCNADLSYKEAIKTSS